MAVVRDFNIYVGAETGLFKGVNINSRQVIAKNLNNLQSLDREQEITCMAWGNDEQTEILMGLRSQKVKVYDTEFKGFSGCVDVPYGKGPLRGLGKINGAVITAAESGHVKLWRFKKSEQVEINALNSGENLSRMRVSPCTSNTIATGGKKNDLQIWDLERPEQPTFKARNVKNDFLDLAVPVWVNDLAFVPNSEQVAICSRHGHVRLYDPRGRGRRPVATCVPEEESWTCIGVAARPNQVVVGSGKGRMLLVDFRTLKTVHAYRGFTGSIRHVVCHPTKPVMASVGLDRFVRVHHLDRQTPLFKTYLKSRLNTLIMREDFDIELDDESRQPAEAETMWNEMEVIKENVAADEDDEETPVEKTNTSTTTTSQSPAVVKKSFSSRKIRKTAA